MCFSDALVLSDFRLFPVGLPRAHVSSVLGYQRCRGVCMACNAYVPERAIQNEPLQSVHTHTAQSTWPLFLSLSLSPSPSFHQSPPARPSFSKWTSSCSFHLPPSTSLPPSPTPSFSLSRGSGGG